MKFKLAYLLILSLPWMGCHHSTQPVENPPDPIRPQEYAALAALFDSSYHCGSDSIVYLRDSTFLLDSTWALDSTLTRLGREFPSITSDLIQDFKAKNLQSCVISNPSLICATLVHEGNSCPPYPYLELSRVAMSSDGRRALVYAAFTEGIEIGEGAFYVLSSHNGKWTIVGRHLLWIA